MNNLSTFKDLYNYLNEINTINNLLNYNFKNIEIQESLLRLFAKLECIKELDNYLTCKGNFNLQEIEKINNFNDIFYYNNELIKLKDNGDISDLTLISKDNSILIATTSKNYKKNTLSYKELDLPNIILKFQLYKNKFKQYKICICLRDKEQFLKYNPNKTSNDIIIKSYLKDLILLDQIDLIKSFETFKIKYNNIKFEELLTYKKLNYRPHQLYTIDKTLEYFSNYKNILWGHIPRSGKTYIMAGLIERYTKNNILIITTSPNETITQYISILENLKLYGFNIINYNKNVLLQKNKNIIIISKQILDHNNNKKLKFDNIDILFIDETHNGGTTNLTEKILNNYKNVKKVYITATYSKVINHYNIDKVINWDLEDIKLCKTKKIIELNNKHEGIIKYFNNIDYEKIYSIYPDLSIIGLDLENEIRTYINDNKLIWNFERLFDLVEYNKTENEKLNTFNKDDNKQFIFTDVIKYYFTYIIKNIIPNIDKKNIEYNQRLIINNNNPSVILCFLPSNNINIISNNLKTIINEIDEEFEICISNTIQTNEKFKINLNKSLIRAKNTNKKAVIVLTGVQGSLGITIPECDLVLLMNNSKSVDFIFQAMFRSMSEAKNKQIGYVIDLNIERVIYSTSNYCNYNYQNYKDNIKHLINNDIIKIYFNDDFKMYDKNIIIDKIYSYYNKFSSKYIDYELNSLTNKQILLSNEQYKQIKSFLFTNKKLSKVSIHDDNIENDTIKLNTDDSKKINSSTEYKEEINENNKQNYMITLKSIIPLICLLTIHDSTIVEYNEMINYIKSKQVLYNILLNQFIIWWNHKMSDTEFDYLTNLFNDLNLQNDKQIINIIETIKNLFIESKNNTEELSKLIDKYLIPQEIEKKKNAEVSTPYKLRQEMLDTIPIEFWSTKQKVFEPCCGKGGFVIDIFNRFKNNSTLTDKEIIEECIYFADINPINIFITKLLIDPNNKYNLNSYEGDTLKINIEKEWQLEGFDAVIGNPPYNSSGTVNTGNTVWQKFVYISLNKWIKINGYLNFVHPAGWRKPEEKNSKSKSKGMFKLICHDNTLISLTIRNTKEGMKMFKCGTRYDYYLIKKSINKGYKTNINDEDYKDYKLNLNYYEWLPNGNIYNIFKIFNKIHDENVVNVIYNANIYESRRKYTSHNLNEEFKYPLIHSTNKKGVRYMYSSLNNKGHFYIKKIIFSKTGIDNFVIDKDGIYGMTELGIGIDLDNLINIDKFIDNFYKLETNNILKYLKYTNYALDWRLFTYLKKDFYNYLK